MKLCNLVIFAALGQTVSSWNALILNASAIIPSSTGPWVHQYFPQHALPMRIKLKHCCIHHVPCTNPKTQNLLSNVCGLMPAVTECSHWCMYCTVPLYAVYTYSPDVLCRHCRHCPALHSVISGCIRVCCVILSHTVLNYMSKYCCVVR